MRVQKWLCVVLSLMLVLSLLPAQVMAAQSGEFEISEQFDAQIEEQLSTATAGPTLAQGNHERWIDRLADLPDYAAAFYTWLEENATATGALADPTLGTAVNSSYRHVVTTFTGTVGFTYTGNGDTANNAQQAAMDDLGDAHQVAMSYATTVFGAFDKDHPEVFWLSGRSRYGYNNSFRYSTNGDGTGTVTYTTTVYFYLQTSDFDIRDENYLSPDLIAAGINQRDADIDAILADCPNTGAYDQIRYLNQVLTQINAYNSEVAVGNSAAAPETAWECISALGGNSGAEGPVCEAYSRAFKVLCDRLEIPCVLVEGEAKSSLSDTPGSHMWNYVKLKGSWYAVDVTWNDPYVSSAPLEKVSGYEREKWLLLGSDSLVSTGLTFIESHEIANSAGELSFTNGPLLAPQAYDPNAVNTVTPTISLVYPSVAFEDEILMNIYFDASDLEDVVELGLITYSTGVSEWTVDSAENVIPGFGFSQNDGYYFVTSAGIAAKDMGSPIYFSIYTRLSDGSYTYTKLYNYSPSTYAYNILNGSAGAEVKALVVAMLNYGAQAQIFFDCNTDNLVNANLTDEQKNLVTAYDPDMLDPIVVATAEKKGETFASNTGFSERTPSISFEGAFAINYYFAPSYEVAGDMTLYIWDAAAYAAADVLSTENATTAVTMTLEEDGRYLGAAEGIAAKELDDTVYVAAVYSDGTNTYTSGILAYSIGAYCENQAAYATAMQPFAQATAVYGYYAKACFTA